MANTCVKCKNDFNIKTSVIPFEGLNNILCSNCYIRVVLQFEKEVQK